MSRARRFVSGTTLTFALSAAPPSAFAQGIEAQRESEPKVPATESKPKEPPSEKVVVTPPPPVEPDSSPGRAQRTIALVVAGAGVVGGVVGGVMYFGGRSKEADSLARCDLRCDPAEETRVQTDARSSKVTGGVIAGIGAAALIGGGVLFFTASSAKTSGPTVAIGPGTLSIFGSF